MEEPKVTIQCLVFNHAKYIRKCLEGFVMQKTNFSFEAIVHDDCSTDGSQDIIREFAEKYPNIIKPIYETENQYSKGTLRQIMNGHSRGKYIALCEGDDFWIDSYKLQRQYDFLEQHQDYVMCYSNFINVDETGNVISRPSYEALEDKSKSGDILKELLITNFILTCTVFYRRAVLAVDFYKKIEYHYDYSLFLTLAVQGKIKYFHEKTAAYRKTSTGAMATQSSLIYKMFHKTRLYFYDGVAGKKFGLKKKRYNFLLKETIIKQCLYDDSDFQNSYHAILCKNRSLWPYLPWFYLEKKVVDIFIR